MFSATMPPVIAELAKELLLKNPVPVQHRQSRDATAVGITQAAYPVPAHLKIALLRLPVASQVDMPSVLVFTRTKHGARKKLARVIAEGRPDRRRTAQQPHAGPADESDGRLPQRRRASVMVATNIAARGLGRGPRHPRRQHRRAGRARRLRPPHRPHRPRRRRPGTPSSWSPRTRKASLRPHRTPSRPAPSAGDIARLRLQPSRRPTGGRNAQADGPPAGSAKARWLGTTRAVGTWQEAGATETVRPDLTP